jgi:site-specific recombinase XerD
MVSNYVNKGTGSLFSDENKPIKTTQAYYPIFNQALVNAGITTDHTPHDCRHTFATLLDNAGANTISIKRLMGHSSGGDVTEKVYTHKDIEQLRIAIELIK